MLSKWQKSWDGGYGESSWGSPLEPVVLFKGYSREHLDYYSSLLVKW
jgi:hypothetical protein